MNYIWGAVNAISAPYQYYKELPPLNPSTLTGAIDVIVIRRPKESGDGDELACSPFHVRFGKWQVLRPAEKKVKVLVNGKPIPFNMKIGEAGEAFFVFETEGEIPENLITSPILAPYSPPGSTTDLPNTTTGRFGAREDGAMPEQEPEFLDLNAPQTTDAAEADALRGASGPEYIVEDTGSDDLLSRTADAGKAVAHAVDEHEQDVQIRLRDRIRARYNMAQKATADYKPGSNPSDEGDEVLPSPPDVQPNEIINNGDIMIDMGGYHSQKPAKKSSQSSDSEGEDRAKPGDTNQIAFPSSSSPPPDPHRTPRLGDPETRPGRPIPFPTGRAGSAPPDDQHALLPPTEEYSWEWGAFPQRSPVKPTFPRSGRSPLGVDEELGLPPSVDAVITDFHRSKSLPPDLEDAGATSEPEPEREHGEKSGDDGPLSEGEEDHAPRGGPRDREGKGTGWGRWWRRGGAKNRTQSVDVRQVDREGGDVEKAAGRLRSGSGAERPSLREIESSPVIPVAKLGEPLQVEPQPATAPAVQITPEASEPEKRYAKTLRLTSEQLESLDLKPGANTLTFSLSASGNVACTASIYLWEHTDHIVVSDIDGTITKSDALGHVFTMIGRDWTHLGVAKLYTDIAKNGYKVMYLTSRAIGQADTTRWYLQSIKQNDHQLPEGPVIMSPDRLLASLHREVIMRKPEVFKMACLRDIQRLFGPTAPHPFYAGFGNRITDAMSYRAVNIPSSRIFTIDSNGEVRMELLELAGYKSPSVASYIHMTDLVDQMFPPINQKYSTEYTDNSYWNAPIVDVQLPDLTPPSPALSARSDQTTGSTLARIRNFSLRGPRATSPEPGTSTPATTEDGQRGRQDDRERPRTLSSISRISGALASLSRSVSPGSPSGTSISALSPARSTTDISEVEEDEFYQKSERRRRQRTLSMPGSLQGSEDEASDGEDEEGDGALFGSDGGDEYGDGDDEGVGGEMEEPTFDEDLFATGEMSKVPFL
ncbi:unnamed protein product [Peniophora sp. CBMAI 1063]|nr:unnamed protein product [Peniophora sp. CBMAI 1063]